MNIEFVIPTGSEGLLKFIATLNSEGVIAGDELAITVYGATSDGDVVFVLENDELALQIPPATGSAGTALSFGFAVAPGVAIVVVSLAQAVDNKCVQLDLDSLRLEGAAGVRKPRNSTRSLQPGEPFELRIHTRAHKVCLSSKSVIGDFGVLCALDFMDARSMSLAAFAPELGYGFEAPGNILFLPRARRLDRPEALSVPFSAPSGTRFVCIRIDGGASETPAYIDPLSMRIRRDDGRSGSPGPFVHEEAAYEVCRYVRTHSEDKFVKLGQQN